MRRRNSGQRKLVIKEDRPTVREVLCHVHQFLQYVEDRMVTPKLFDKDVMKIKVKQCWSMLYELDPYGMPVTKGKRP